MQSNTQHDSEKGSFLLELLIAVGIISLSFAVIVDAFLTTQRAFYTTSDKADLTSSLTFLMEDMTREARVSDSYRCSRTGTVPTPGSSCGGGTPGEFSMTRIPGLNEVPREIEPGYFDQLVTYRLVGSKIVKIDNESGSDETYDMTPPNVFVEQFRVYVLGTEEDGTIRARVTLNAYYDENFNSTQDNTEQMLYLQTSFTARVF